MRLHELITNSDLDMTLPQIKAFFLGVMTADRPMPFNQALDELLSEFPESRDQLGPVLKKFWDELEGKKNQELSHLFNEFSDLETSKDQLDYFLTALSLSGTNSETCKDEEVGELIEDLEDLVMDLEDYLADDPGEAEGEKLRAVLLAHWREFIEARPITLETPVKLSKA